MKYRIATVAIAVFVLLSPQNMFAACPNITGPHNWPTCAATYYDYDVSECASTSQPSDSDVCGLAGYSYNYVSPGGEAFTTYSFTVAGSGGTNWELRQRVDFTETQNSQFDFVWLRLTVTRSGSQIYSNMFFTHNGTEGDGCYYPGVTSFSAQNGDVIAVEVGSQALYSGTTISVSDPILLRFAC